MLSVFIIVLHIVQIILIVLKALSLIDWTWSLVLIIWEANLILLLLLKAFIKIIEMLYPKQYALYERRQKLKDHLKAIQSLKE